jgi:hypothetical protein
LRRGDGAGQDFGGIGDGLADAPHRAGPGGVVRPAADHVDVQLGRDVAELADIELVDRSADGGGHGLHRGSGQHDLLHQLLAVLRRQMLDLARAHLARDQDDPGPAGVELQAGVAKLQVGQRLGRRREGGMQGELVQGGEVFLLRYSACAYSSAEDGARFARRGSYSQQAKTSIA